MKKNVFCGMWQLLFFATNALLNLYRYTTKTRDSLFSALDKLKDRVWMPHQVAFEFMNRRCEVIYETIDKYEKLKSEFKIFTNEVKNNLRLTPKDEEFIDLKNYLTNWLKQNKENNLVVQESQMLADTWNWATTVKEIKPI